jgi:hypothetical protein
MSMTVLRNMSSQERREAGMVAIMVTLILMIVISLIVLGFAQITRRNQRQALDRQLSAQAFYAAETGVNDVAQLIDSAPPGTVIPPKDSCESSGDPFYGSLNPVIGPPEDGVQYTCLLVDPSPSSLEYRSIGTTGTIFPVIAEAGSIGSIRLTWTPVPGDEGDPPPTQQCPTSSSLSSSTAFPNASGWACGYGILRFDLVPTAGSLSMNGLQNSLMTTFAVPLRSGGSSTITYSGGPANSRVGTACTNTSCRLTINLSPAGTRYHMRVLALYKELPTLTVEAFSGPNASGSVVSLRDAQILVDSTGKAQDVLRRIQVRLPFSSSLNSMGDYAIQSTDAVCKRFSVMENRFQSFANSVVPGVGDDAASTNNPLCD